MRSVEASEAELALAQRALEAAHTVLGSAGDALLYARVDMLPGDEGEPILLELEFTEPSMFLSKAPESLARFADAIAARATR
jgi:hypothetical protein